MATPGNEETPKPQIAGSRVDAGPKTQSGPLGRVDPPKPAPPGTVPRPPVGIATGALFIGLAALIATLVVFGSIADGVRDQEVFALDTWATPFLHAISSPGVDALMNGLTTMGSSYVVLPVFLVAVAALLLRRRYGATLFLSVALSGSLIIDFVMKLIFQRPRPKLDYAAVLPDYSFPSGHSMNGVVFYISIALILWAVFGRRVGLTSTAIAVVLAFGIGLSRIYLGYHYLTDVVGGWLAGAVWLLLVGAAFRIRPQVWSWRGRMAAVTAVRRRSDLALLHI
jgi:undecaprenyl-diphosphatase